MCGIIAAQGRVDDTQVSEMLRRLRHRGPDDEGRRRHRDMVVGHRRLSIVDVEGGHQPFANEDGTIFLTSNGEIYNHGALREELGDHGFRSLSDNEVILHLYESGDLTFPRRLNGMFAFVIAGPAGLYAARDPLGIKPLFIGYRQDGDGETILLASEMKALHGFADRIEELPAGNYFTPRDGCRVYRDILDPARQGVFLTDADEAAKELHRRLQGAVTRQLMSDVPLGTLLSGGLDSSLIAAIAVRAGRERDGRRLHSFALGFGEEAGDLPAARAVAERLGTQHHERICNAEEALAVLPDVLYHLESFDPALVRNAVPTYLVAELAAEHVKVVLSGEGADELFAGYDWYRTLHGEELHRDLYRSLREMQVYNLHRVDGMSMAHSLEVRPPFLELDVVEFALAIHPDLKLRTRGPGEAVTEKWILRQAFRGDADLPQDILWREKAQFASGSGITDLLREQVEARVSDTEFERRRNMIDPPLRSKEELYYFDVFRDLFPDRVMEQAAYRWWPPDSPHREAEPLLH